MIENTRELREEVREEMKSTDLPASMVLVVHLRTLSAGDIAVDIAQAGTGVRTGHELRKKTNQRHERGSQSATTHNHRTVHQFVW